MQNGHLINILALKSTSTYWYLISNLVSNTQCSGSPQICRLPSFPCYPLISLKVWKSKQALHYFQRAERPASWSCFQNQTGGGGGEALGLVTKLCLGPIPDSNPPMLLSGSSTSPIQGSLLFTLPGVDLPSVVSRSNSELCVLLCNHRHFISQASHKLASSAGGNEKMQGFQCSPLASTLI